MTSTLVSCHRLSNLYLLIYLSFVVVDQQLLSNYSSNSLPLAPPRIPPSIPSSISHNISISIEELNMGSNSSVAQEEHRCLHITNNQSF